MTDREITFAMIKTHALASYDQNRVLNAILERVADEKLAIRAIRFAVLEPETIARLYQEHRDRPYYPGLCRSVSGSVVLMALAGHDVIARWRAVLGATDPAKALPGTLRRTYGSLTHMADNVAHGSDSKPAAWRELALIFPDQIELWTREGLLVRPVREDDPAEAAGPGHVQ